MIIDVILKCCNRPWDITLYLDYWIEVFGQYPKYNIIIWNDSKIDLSEKYPDIKIVTKENFKFRDKLNSLLKNSCIKKRRWLDSGFAILSTFYIAETDIFWNIDADDMMFEKPVNMKILENIENYLRNNNLFSMSWDIWWSNFFRDTNHLIDFHRWAFGIACCKKDLKFLEDILTTIKSDEIVPPINIDNIVGSQLEKVKVFVFENTLAHQRPTREVWAHQYIHPLKVKAKGRTTNLYNATVFYEDKIITVNEF